VVLTGLMIGMIGTMTAHELTHRTWDPATLASAHDAQSFSPGTVTTPLTTSSSLPSAPTQRAASQN
jgi:hypothetical protein